MKALLALLFILAVPPVFISSCSAPSLPTALDQSFAPVRVVLETQCVHCHGENRLAQMPSIHDTKALARLIGPVGWIVPGKPEKSRFYQVVVFPDEVPGAMPPTGHAISRREADTLRIWIKSGAALPKNNQTFQPQGAMPRSI
jgi:hypothetical protein